jgi:hypothetical protein
MEPPIHRTRFLQGGLCEGLFSTSLCFFSGFGFCRLLLGLYFWSWSLFWGLLSSLPLCVSSRVLGFVAFCLVFTFGLGLFFGDYCHVVLLVVLSCHTLRCSNSCGSFFLLFPSLPFSCLLSKCLCLVLWSSCRVVVSSCGCLVSSCRMCLYCVCTYPVFVWLAVYIYIYIFFPGLVSSCLLVTSYHVLDLSRLVSQEKSSV